MNTALADRVAELEAERWQPTPRVQRPVTPKPITDRQAAANRAALLEALRNSA